MDTGQTIIDFSLIHNNNVISGIMIDISDGSQIVCICDIRYSKCGIIHKLSRVEADNCIEIQPPVSIHNLPLIGSVYYYNTLSSSLNGCSIDKTSSYSILRSCITAKLYFLTDKLSSTGLVEQYVLELIINGEAPLYLMSADVFYIDIKESANTYLGNEIFRLNTNTAIPIYPIQVSDIKTYTIKYIIHQDCIENCIEVIEAKPQPVDKLTVNNHVLVSRVFVTREKAVINIGKIYIHVKK
jgi:hypothetical protein